MNPACLGLLVFALTLALVVAMVLAAFEKTESLTMRGVLIIAFILVALLLTHIVMLMVYACAEHNEPRVYTYNYNMHIHAHGN